MSFKKIYKEVVELQKLDAEITGASALHHLAKTAEEFGELTQEVNKTTGRKKLKPDDTPAKIKQNILEEGVDTIQCVISILASQGISYSQVKASFKNKNFKWKSQIEGSKK